MVSLARFAFLHARSISIIYNLFYAIIFYADLSFQGCFMDRGFCLVNIINQNY